MKKRHDILIIKNSIKYIISSTILLQLATIVAEITATSNGYFYHVLLKCKCLLCNNKIYKGFSYNQNTHIQENRSLGFIDTLYMTVL